MAPPWSRVRICLARANNSNVSRFTTFVFAKRYVGTRTFHSHQQQQQQQLQHGQTIFGDGARKLLTCTAFVAATGLGYALYNWRDDIRQIIKSSNPTVRAISSDSNQKRDKFNFIADAVEISAPAVVYIEIRDSKRIDYFSEKPILISNGSGFIINQNGLILTSAHVVANKPNISLRIQVRLHDGSTYTGTVEDVDLQSDLATVRINKNNLPTMKLGSSANLRPGEFVVAIGAPLTLSNTITSGIVSSVNRPSQELGLNSRNMGLIQTDAAITFGNSGGPLVNLNGEAIGINSMKVTSGISFAIPIDHAKEFLKKSELRRKNKDISLRETPRKRYMGITMQTLTPEILNEMQQYHEYMNVQHGVLVWKVIVGSPAYNAGLKSGDIMTHANSEPVMNSSDIYNILEQSGPIQLKILRKGRILHLQVHPENI